MIFNVDNAEIPIGRNISTVWVLSSLLNKLYSYGYVDYSCYRDSLVTKILLVAKNRLVTETLLATNTRLVTEIRLDTETLLATNTRLVTGTLLATEIRLATKIRLVMETLLVASVPVKGTDTTKLDPQCHVSDPIVEKTTSYKSI